LHLNNKGKELIAKELLKNCSVKLKSQKVDAIQLSWKEGSVKEGAPITENISSSEILNTSTNHHSRETTITVMKESTLDQPNPSLINSPTNEQEILNTFTCGHTMEPAAPGVNESTSDPSWTATPSSNQESLHTNTGGNTIVSTIPARKEPTFEQIIPSLTTSPSISNTTTSDPSTVPTIPVRNESTSDQTIPSSTASPTNNQGDEDEDKDTRMGPTNETTSPSNTNQCEIKLRNSNRRKKVPVTRSDDYFW